MSVLVSDDWAGSGWEDFPKEKRKAYTPCSKAQSLVWRSTMKDYVKTLTVRHGALYAQRIDLFYPSEISCDEINPNNRDFTTFIKYLDKAISRQEKGFGCKRVGHIAFREFGDVKNKKHYHAIVFFKASEMVLDNKRYQQNDALNQLYVDKWETISGGRGVYFYNSAIVTKETGLPVQWVNYLTKPEGKYKDGFNHLLKGDELLPKKEIMWLNKCPLIRKCSKAYDKAVGKKQKTLVIAGTLHPSSEMEGMIEEGLVVQFLEVCNKKLCNAGRGYLTAGVAALQHTTERGLASFAVFLDGHKNGWARLTDMLTHKVHDILVESWHHVTGKGMMLIDKVHLIQGRKKEHVSKNRGNKKDIFGVMFETGKKTLSVLSQFFKPKKKNGQKK